MITREMFETHMPALTQEIRLDLLPPVLEEGKSYFTRADSGRAFRTMTFTDWIDIREHSQNDFHLVAQLDHRRQETPTLKYNLYTEIQANDDHESITSLLNGHGGEFYQGAHAILEYFTDIARILEIWSYGVNLEQYYSLLQDGLTPTEAALGTWSGFQAQQLGYAHAEQARDVEFRHDQAVAFYLTRD